MATFELYRDQDRQFRWRLRAGNGRIIADSGEGYVRRIDCEHGIELLKTETAGAVVKDLTAAEA